MLVLSRRNSQQIHIGQGIIVTIIAVQGGRVRIGIDAPRDVSVRRGEIRLQKDSTAEQERQNGETRSPSMVQDRVN